MYLNDRNSIYKVILQINNLLNEIIKAKSFKYLDVCIEGLNDVYKILVELNIKFDYSKIEIYINKLTEIQNEDYNSDFINEIKQIIVNLTQLNQQLLQQKVRYRAVFIPYQASMWTSLESIWQAALNDPDCDTYVIVSPYYVCDPSKNITNLQYNVNAFPNNVSIVHFNDFNIADERPEMIFIHNGYDAKNNLTQLPKQFHCKTLKNYTNMLVYSPYGSLITYDKKTIEPFCKVEGVKHAHKVLVPSNFEKEIYIAHDNEESKFIAFGSPKTDAIVNKIKNYKNVPGEWKEIIKGKKVFLLNLHFGYFIVSYMYAKNKGDIGKYYYAQKVINNIIEIFSNTNDCVLIWRPHPLLKVMLETRFPELVSDLIKLELFINKSDNCIYDQFGDYTKSFNCSDAMISTYSSLIGEYMITTKPVLILEPKMPKEIDRTSPIHHNVNYFYKPDDEVYGTSYLHETYNCFAKPFDFVGDMNIESYIEMVKEGIDSKFNERVESINKSFTNLDGTVGQKVYEQIKKELIAKSTI